MSVESLLKEDGWDAPFFKVLARNDTGAAAGHQGGMVIPQDLRSFFPGLSGATSPENPTLSYRILADLYMESTFIEIVDTRYQFQTWGGERSPESRLTDHLAPIRNKAKGEDVLLIQRDLGNLDHYRLILVRKDSPEYAKVAPRFGGRRWGVLESAPMSDVDLSEAEGEEKNREAAQFSLFDSNAKIVVSAGKSVARSLAFRMKIQNIYNESCAVCDTALMLPSGRSEMEAAHIVPRSRMGADDARNGIGLCKRHHWAFDAGLFGLDKKRRIWVPDKIKVLSANKPLVEFHGKPIRESNEPNLIVAQEALDWHMTNIVKMDSLF